MLAFIRATAHSVAFWAASIWLEDIPRLSVPSFESVNAARIVRSGKNDIATDPNTTSLPILFIFIIAFCFIGILPRNVSLSQSGRILGPWGTGPINWAVSLPNPRTKVAWRDRRNP